MVRVQDHGRPMTTTTKRPPDADPDAPKAEAPAQHAIDDGAARLGPARGILRGLALAVLFWLLAAIALYR